MATRNESSYRVVVDKVNDEEFAKLAPDVGALVDHNGTLKKGNGLTWDEIGGSAGQFVLAAYIKSEEMTILQKGIDEDIVYQPVNSSYREIRSDFFVGKRYREFLFTMQFYDNTAGPNIRDWSFFLDTSDLDTVISSQGIRFSVRRNQQGVFIYQGFLKIEYFPSA